MILIIDNYDSFTHNLVQYVGELGYSVQVLRNDKISLDNLKTLTPTHIIISPGPGKPQEAGISLNIIKELTSTVPILGVCLGHQSIGYIAGCQIKQLKSPMHGKLSKIYHNGEDIFSEIPNPFIATRYHSLIIDEQKIPDGLKITARTDDGIIMGCQYKDYPFVRGIQFHPESLWTDNGKKIISNFLRSKM